MRGLLALFLLTGFPFVVSANPKADKVEDLQAQAIAEVIYYAFSDECPEQFEDKKFHADITDNNWAVMNLSGDGSKLVFLVLQPHILQTGTILIYQAAKDGKVTRVTEGLAPGPLLPNSGKLLDSHTFDPKKSAQSVDILIDQNLDKFIKAAIGNPTDPAHVVRYPKFIHMDFRKGKGGYLDMSSHKEFGKEETCANFEFSPVETISAGRIEGAPPGHYLAAVVGDQIYVYQIKGITTDGFLEKELTIITTPRDLDHFVYDGYQTIRYANPNGQTKNLTLSK